MTTTVIVKAHCAKEKQVRITRTGSEDKVIQDGEVFDCVVYDAIQVTVNEELKPETE